MLKTGVDALQVIDSFLSSASTSLLILPKNSFWLVAERTCARICTGANNVISAGDFLLFKIHLPALRIDALKERKVYYYR